MVVLLFHYAGSDLTPIAPTSFIGRYGYIGVPLFFMISGFVILKSAEGKDLRSFVVARAVRLYPAFWICCTITAAFTGLLTSQSYVANMLTMGTSNMPMIDGSYWTLALEIKFYAAIAIVMALGRLDRIDLFLWGWLALAAWNPTVWARSAFMLDYTGCFAFGCALLLVRQRFTWDRLALVACSLAVALMWAGINDADRAAAAKNAFEPGVAAGCVLVCAGLLVAAERLRAPRWFALLGAISYPLYLLHSQVGHYFLFKLESPLGEQSWTGLVITTVWVIALAWAAYRFGEKPLRAALLRVLGERLSQATPRNH